MVKKKAKNNAKKEEKPVEKPKESLLEQPQAPQIPAEMKEKLDKIKEKIEKFKTEILKKFDKYILGVALFPPNKEDKKKKDDINVFVLVDDADSTKMSKEELSTKLGAIIESIAKEIDPHLKPQTMVVTELKESCFDGKYEVLEMIAKSGIVYDKGILGALKVSEVHKTMAISKFEKYVIGYVAAGSLFRGDANPNDIDVYIVIDDTDVKKMSRAELKDKLRAIIAGMGFEAGKITGVDAHFHVQTYILTDFWDSIRDANPVIFTFLRDGVPLYDRGVFMPWKLLLQMGKIKPSPEAIDMNMDIGEKLLQRVKAKLLSVVGEDLYYAALNPSQAALMLYGIPPPTPKETVKLLDDIFVKKEKLLEKKYVDTLEKVRAAYKAIEHGKMKEISGKEIDGLVTDVEAYLKRIRRLFTQIEKKAEVKNMEDLYDTVMAVTRDAIMMVTDKKVTDVEKGFKDHLIDEGKLPEKLYKILKSVLKAKKDFEEKKLAKQEVEKVSKEARMYIKVLIEFIQRSRGIELERAKIRFKYGDTFGEVILLDKVAFLTPDLEKREEIQKATLDKDGGLGKVEKSNMEDMEKHMVDAKIPEKVFIKEKIFESLKKLFGKDIHVLISY
ncbi:MAG: hypothetical protein KKA79_07520 [Nanoarchaeota archaeon]|nr:hypothetical protein [Nanoarchaeota archaeon]MCG2717988.1 hypothetical protein [Nanoarchaeota archaeon]